MLNEQELLGWLVELQLRHRTNRPVDAVDVLAPHRYEQQSVLATKELL